MRGLALVGGGTGFVGRHLVKHLKTKGYETISVSRQEGKGKLTWDDIKTNGLPSKTSAVLNVAGENVLNFTKLWSERFKQEVYKSRVETTKLLANAISESSKPPKAFVTISGVGIYPPSDTKEYNESSEVQSFDFLSQMCHDWEAAAVLQNNQSLCRVVTIRSGVVLGKDGGIIKNLLIPFKFYLGGAMGLGNQHMPWIHMDDLIHLFSFCVENNVSGILNGVSPHIISNTQFATALGHALRRPTIFRTPAYVFDILYGKERAIMITKGQIVHPKRTEEVGFEYKHPDIVKACHDIVNSD